MKLKATIKNRFNALRRFINDLKRPSKQTNTRLLEKRGETLVSFTIRDATATDVPKLGALHATVWGQTYSVPPKPQNFAIREYQWREEFQKNDGSWFCLVIEKPNGELIGFAKGKINAHGDPPSLSGDLNKIYLLQDYHRMGLGRKLFGHVVRRFLNRGIDSMVLFGVPENPSCYFHEAMGGQRLYAENGGFNGGYQWQDLHQLAAICPVE